MIIMLIALQPLPQTTEDHVKSGSTTCSLTDSKSDSSGSEDDLCEDNLIEDDLELSSQSPL